MAGASASSAFEFAGDVGGCADDGAGAIASGGGIKASTALTDAVFGAAAILGTRGAVFTTEGVATTIATVSSADPCDTSQSAGASAILGTRCAIFAAQCFTDSISTTLDTLARLTLCSRRTGAIFGASLAVFVRLAGSISAGWRGAAGIEAVLTDRAIAINGASGAIFALVASAVAAGGTATVVADLAGVASAILGTGYAIFVVSAVSIAASACAYSADTAFSCVASAVLRASLAVFAALCITNPITAAFATVGVFANASKGLGFKFFASAVAWALCVIFADALSDATASSDADPSLKTWEAFDATLKAEVGLVACDANQAAITKKLRVA